MYIYYDNIALKIDRCIAIYLHVISYNETAIKFYKKNKYKNVAKIDNYYNFDDKNYDAFVFMRIISKIEKEEFKIRSGIAIKENKFYFNHIYKYIIKIIILLACNIINYLNFSFKKE